MHSFLCTLKYSAIAPTNLPTETSTIPPVQLEDCVNLRNTTSGYVYASYNADTSLVPVTNFRAALERHGHYVWQDVSQLRCFSLTEALGHGIMRSAAVVIFLTRGYLLSRNNSVELRFAFVLNKPVFIVELEDGLALPPGLESLQAVHVPNSVEALVHALGGLGKTLSNIVPPCPTDLELLTCSQRLAPTGGPSTSSDSELRRAMIGFLYASGDEKTANSLHRIAESMNCACYAELSSEREAEEVSDLCTESDIIVTIMSNDLLISRGNIFIQSSLGMCWAAQKLVIYVYPSDSLFFSPSIKYGFMALTSGMVVKGNSMKRDFATLLENLLTTANIPAHIVGSRQDISNYTLAVQMIPESVGAWLANHGLADVAPIFIEHQIDGMGIVRLRSVIVSDMMHETTQFAATMREWGVHEDEIVSLSDTILEKFT